jgi:membrane-bound lytic murein transglycosylase D
MGKVKRTVERTGKRTFWQVYPHLPQETRAYVPQFVALAYTLNYYKEHNIFPDPDSLLSPIDADSILVQQHLSLPALAKCLDVDHRTLKHLNPTLRRHCTPANVPYYLKFPKSQTDFFTLNQKELLDSASIPVPDHYLAPYLLKQDRKALLKRQLAARKPKKTKKAFSVDELQLAMLNAQIVVPAASSNLLDSSVEKLNQDSSTTKKRRTSKLKAGQMDTITKSELPELPVALNKKWSDSHKQPIPDHTTKTVQVLQGQGIYSIARLNNISVTQLCAWNKLSTKAKLTAGQLLVVTDPGECADTAVGEYAKIKTDPELPTNIVVVKQSQKAQLAQSVRRVAKTYRVQPGDTLWTICQKYEGLTINEIVKLNRLKNRRITPGQKLILG